MAAVRSKKTTKQDKHSYVYYKKHITPSLNNSKTLRRCLKQAFFEGDWCMARHLLGKGANINYRYGSHGETLLFYCNTTDQVKGLVELGADINAKNKNGQSLLGHAIRRYWSMDLIRLLLKYGAHVNAQGPFGYSPLGLAVIHQAKNLELIELMMGYKANINGTDKYNKHKPMGDAMTNKNCGKMLIKYGVLHNAENDCKKIVEKEREKGNMCGFPEVDQYLEACIGEVAIMRQEFVNGKNNLCEFLNQSQNGRLHIDSTIDVSRFHIYKDLIQETIKRVTHRNNLLKELNAVRVQTPSGQEMVRLDYDSIFEIADYLDNEDLQSLIGAFK